MVFSSLFFLYCFMPLCLLTYAIVKPVKAKNWVLLIFSLFFYAWGEPAWVILMILTGLFVYWSGLRIDRYRGQAKSRLYLVLAIIGTLSSLAIFKYSGFFVENLNLVTGLQLAVPRFNLPIGISFYTFQTLTYAIDLYRGKCKVQRSPVNFLLYEALFPQLIAGPIVRYADVADQIDNRKVTSEGFIKGISRFSIGLGKKVLVANYAGELAAQTIGGSLDKLGIVDGWIGLLAFTLQIYFDFSGYSDMAIGLGHMFGFDFKENFNYPYISRSVTDFWRRWHISLSTFFRDYVYIPMGGNRRRQIFNLFVVWGLTGLWHGASWNFILWGLYYFVLLILEKKILLSLFDRLPRFIGHLYTLLAVMIGWVFFYFTDLASIGQMLRLLFGFARQPAFKLQGDYLLLGNLPFLFFAAVAATPLMAGGLRSCRRRLLSRNRHPFVTAADMSRNLILLFACTATLVASTYNPFLYFRF
ncbi:MAG TPA: membrane-bound O-acyltransferase family protein [Clostridiales bacterium]|nr:membrane-bound O-acyltransferase family protein [Clostridiales bacterium]